jgi:hypothetical protein
MSVPRAIRSFLEYLRMPVARSAAQFGDEIEQEIAFHIAERAQEYITQGMSEDAAHRAARARFGDPARVAAECHVAAIGIPVLWHRVHLALTAVLMIVASGFWWTSTRSATDPRLLADSLPRSIASFLGHDWSGDITGTVLDDQGNPIRDAQILVVVKTWPDGSYFQRPYETRSDANGRFLIENVYPVNELYELQITALASTGALQSSYFENCRGELDPLAIELTRSVGFAVQIESQEGTLLSSIEVLPTMRLDTNGTEHSVYFDNAKSLMKRTDSSGRVVFPYFDRGDLATVLIRSSGGKWHSHDLFVPATSDVVKIRVSVNDKNEIEES